MNLSLSDSIEPRMITSEKAQSLLSSVGSVSAQPSSDWAGKVPLPDAIAKFYAEVGPQNIKINLPGNPYLIPNLSKLWKIQTGYRIGLKGEPNVDWDQSWYVVADAGGGDALVLDEPTGAVFHVYAGEDKWESVKVFPDLNSMAAALAVISSAVSKLGKAKDPFSDEFRSTLIANLEENLDESCDPETIVSEIGWD